jgi:succinoglycan biosynthesis transport protein ExoP
VAEQMRQVDAQIAALKSKYGEALPEFLQRNQSTVEDIQRQLTGLQQQVLVAQEKESVLSVQLSQMSPNLITQSGDLTDIATVRAKLTEAEQRYTPDHPEVKRLRHALEVLMAQNGTSAGMGVTKGSNNPQYQLTATQLQAARNELGNLQAQENTARAKLEQYRGLVLRTPAAEREVAEVLRRREVLQNQYQRAQDRLQSANLAETFESKQGGERFTLLRAPVTPRSPVYPNRVGLILLGLVIGAVLSGIAVAASEATDKNVRIARDLPMLNDVPLLASIPVIRNTRDKRRRVVLFGSFLAAYSLAACAAIAVIVSARYR